tara:strand:- start:62 stop:442 length:381 start_codon:yes stop_codon:yes gene_type:complete
MLENILLIIVLIMFVYLVLIFINWIKDILQIFIKIISYSNKPTIHKIDGSWEDFGRDPFEVFCATKNINIGDVIVCSSGSWRGVYWQKVSNIDWTTSLELQKLCGGSEEIFNIWSEKNKNLEKKVC